MSDTEDAALMFTKVMKGALGVWIAAPLPRTISYGNGLPPRLAAQAAEELGHLDAQLLRIEGGRHSERRERMV